MFIEGRQAISRLQLEIMRKDVASQFGVTEEMTFRGKIRTAAQRWKEKTGRAAIQEWTAKL
jgi:hypothetical protein